MQGILLLTILLLICNTLEGGRDNAVALQVAQISPDSLGEASSWLCNGLANNYCKKQGTVVPNPTRKSDVEFMLQESTKCRCMPYDHPMMMT